MERLSEEKRAELDGGLFVDLRRRIPACFFIATLAILSPAVARAQLKCSVEMPVYDPFGRRLPFRIGSVRPVGVPRGGTVDPRVAGTYRVSKSGTAIEFTDAWIKSNGFEVQLVGPGAAKLDVTVPLALCGYRQSTVFGNNDTGADVAYSVISGRVTGCKLEGDWWVRAVPMFGGGKMLGGFEGFVDRATGAFTIAGNPSGERYVILLGRDKEVVRTVSIDVAVGGKNLAPAIVLTSKCQ